MENNLVIELYDVGKRYGRKELFQGITKVIQPGQCIAVTGSNGSGKSTLLKLIAGITRPTAGTIRLIWQERILDNEQRLQFLGLLSPELVFYNNLTGIENLLFFAKGRGVICTSQQAKAAIAKVGLQTDNFLGTYSTGMKQRLKLALIQMISPPLWLLDEPSSNLDKAGKTLVETCIKGALHSGATVIIATNESWEAKYASDKISLN
ncbi:MAG: ABC transporter ATP-binding protein [Pelosinus sp.]|nr:ABC transporter ATP-binding protein [Pelosinus sp.]